ncbi:unnamed protein product [Effrenium voratum]|nr:unnamed protein product [Effrenium voratum]
MDLIALVRQGLIVQGNSVVGAAVAYAMDLVYVALVKPEFGMSWLTAGGAPRLLLPHCSAVDFAEALPWEGVTRPHDPMHWLHPLLERLEEKAFLNVEVSDRDAAPDCELNGFGSFQDPVCGLAKLGRHDTLVLQRSLTSCVGQSTCLGGAQLIPGARSLQGPLRLEIDEAEAIIADRGVDVLALSPKAGNCAELKRLLEWMGATPQVLVLNINPVLAVPLRVAPDFLRARKLGEHLDSCSLQTATDFLAPQFLPLFVDTARAVFVAQAALSRFGKVGHLPSLWRRGVSCTLPISEWLGEKVVQEAAALGGADWPCQKLLDSNVPRLPLAAMRGVQNKELYKEVRCGGHAGQLNLEPATLPMTPGRGQMLRGRGRCFPEDGFCECFPPWRDALCDKEDLGDRQDEPQGVLIATRLSHAPGGMEMLRQNLHNWWESFNHQLDRPILIFHQGLSRSEASQLRASPNRVWFSHLGPLLRRPRKIYKEKHDEALHCRFKFAWVIEEPSIESYAPLMQGTPKLGAESGRLLPTVLICGFLTWLGRRQDIGPWQQSCDKRGAVRAGNVGTGDTALVESTGVKDLHGSGSVMAKSKNHTGHNQIYKNHRNGIKKTRRPRKMSMQGMNCRFVRNQAFAKRGMKKLSAEEKEEQLKAQKEAQKRIDEKRRAEREALRRTLEEVLRGCVIEIG